MTYPAIKILNPPTPEMMKDEVAFYRFMLEIYNRTGGAKPNGADLSGLKASVQELNSLIGITPGITIQEQLNSKIGGVVVPDQGKILE